MGKIIGYKHGEGSVKGVDPRLWDTVQHAIAAIPYDAQIRSGSESRGVSDKGNHMEGYAVDITLIDPQTGKALPDTASVNNGATFGAYEQMAQAARVYQTQTYPELDNTFRWGGGFSQGGTPGDLMHLDITPSAQGRMAYYSWDHGLNAAGQARFPQAVSNGGLGGSQGARVVSALRQSLSTGAPVPPGSIPGDAVPNSSGSPDDRSLFKSSGQVMPAPSPAFRNTLGPVNEFNPLPAPAPLVTPNQSGSPDDRSTRPAPAPPAPRPSIYDQMPKDASYGIQQRIGAPITANTDTAQASVPMTALPVGAPVDDRTMSLAHPNPSVAAGSTTHPITALGSAPAGPSLGLTASDQAGINNADAKLAAQSKQAALNARDVSTTAAPTPMPGRPAALDQRAPVPMPGRPAAIDQQTAPTPMPGRPAALSPSASVIAAPNTLIRPLGGGTDGLTALGNEPGSGPALGNTEFYPSEDHPKSNSPNPSGAIPTTMAPAGSVPMAAKRPASIPVPPSNLQLLGGNPTLEDIHERRDTATAPKRTVAAVSPTPMPGRPASLSVVSSTPSNGSNKTGAGNGNGGGAQTIKGSATGKTYTVGQTYSNANGNFVAQSDGTFKKVG